MVNKASLILNGEIDQDWLEKALTGKPLVYCADGAYDKVRNLSFNIEAVIGDFDSISDKSSVESQLIHMPDQDYTDFEKALKFLKEIYEQIDIYGASGNEMDHFIGNLSVAKKYRDELFLKFIDPSQYYFFIEKETLLEDVKGKIISVIPFPKIEHITSEGLEYELQGQSLELGSLISVRNHASKNQVRIKYESGCGIIFVSS
jgi:thiamine pyrophosphokinase